MKFWRHVNLSILKDSDLVALKFSLIFRKVWNISHFMFAIFHELKL